MDDLKAFKKYFNRDFWRFFNAQKFLFDIPRNETEKERFIEAIHAEILTRKYYPSVPHCYIDQDKGRGVTRIIPVFTIADYCIYYYCIKKIEDKIAINRVENTFGGWTLGGILRKSENDEMEKRRSSFNSREDFIAELNGESITQYTFNPSAWVRAYGELNSKLYAISQENKYKYYAELDIANYYDSIRLDILEIRIREIVNQKYADVISLLFHFLNYWNRDVNLYNKQTVGIPQDAVGDLSRILANFYLQPYDRYVFDLCKKSGCKYLRFADDQFLFSEDKNKLNFLIFKISKRLNSLGLSVNQKKVKIGTTEELIKFRSFEAFDLVKDMDDRNDKNKVERFVDYYLALLEEEGLMNIKDRGMPLLNRALSCQALKRIDFLKKNKLLSCYLDEEYLKNSRAYQLEKIYKLLSRADRHSFLEKLNRSARKSIHNAFHLELLIFYSENGIDTKNILRRIEKLKKI